MGPISYQIIACLCVGFRFSRYT